MVNEENKTPAEQSAEAEKRRQQKKSERSVVRYISVLFAAAFVLLLLTFSMEMRQHQQIVDQNEAQIEDLNKKTSSAVQKLNNIMAENEKLKEQMHESKLSQQSMQTTVDQQTKALQAMDWFWQINESYVRGRHAQAKELIEQMEAKGLETYLPHESTTETDRFSPYDRYMEIRETVF